MPEAESQKNRLPYKMKLGIFEFETICILFTCLD